MPDATTLGLYFSAAVLLAVSPGPGMFYVLTRSLKGGRRDGYRSALGTAVGGLFHVVAAALGLSAVLATSTVLFAVVKYAGAAYLIYLGIRTLMQREPLDTPEDAETGTGRAVFYQGVITEMLNPKTALFFLAFIPQFVDPTQPVVTQFILLGCVSVLLNTSADLVVATFSGPLSTTLRNSRRARQAPRLLSGGGLVALGLFVALSGNEQTAQP